MKTNLFTVLVITALLTSPSASQAASIGVQFLQTSQSATSLQVSGETAGVPGVAQANWNTLLTDSIPLASYQDSTGATAGTFNLTLGSGVQYMAGSGFPAGGDQKLASSTYLAAFGGNPTLTLTNIPYAQYSIYLYGLNDNNAGADRHTSVYNGSTYQSFLATNDSTAWVLASGTWNGTGSAPVESVANYVLFSGMSGSTATISWKSQGNSGINGFQIVDTSAVPEPSTYALLGVGSLLLFGLRRRNLRA